MKRVIVLIMFLFFTSFIPQSLNAELIQWAISDGGNGHWYERVDLDVGIYWDDAKIAAEALDYNGVQGHLLTVTSEEEDTFVISHLILPIEDNFPERPRNGDWFPYWLGGYQDPVTSYGEPGAEAENWHWITGEPWSYTNWYGGEPNDAGMGDVIPSPSDYYEDNSENFLTYWTETNMDDGILNYGWNDLPGSSAEARLGYFVEYETNGNPVPEPATMLLIGAGLAGLAGFRKKFKKA